ncbi:hypothetical protein F2Q68_00006736 [Brassica cretica]|uniref:Uncharacterized protein n=1 Tax=Brassica cretica TaxID=69181 RepID=A0A8S9J579_BRACR|nr:hypothetical protein F2Q68_00006736 [Brassica cretica]
MGRVACPSILGFRTRFRASWVFQVPVCSKRGDGLHEVSKFVPSRGVLFVACRDPSRVYNASSSFLPPSGFLTFLFSLSLLTIFRNLHCSSKIPPRISRMKSKPDLALDSSSIGDREVKNPSRVVVEAVSPAVEVDRFLLVGPLSTIGVEEVVNWREKCHLPDDVVIRIPGPIDRVSDFEVDEDPVYEGFFESSFRDRIPSLVAKVSEALEISPS